MFIIPALERLRKVDCKSEARLSYTESSRPVARPCIKRKGRVHFTKVTLLCHAMYSLS